MTVLEDMKETLIEKGIDHLDQIILCGGATRMPQIEQGIAEIYPDVEIFGKDRDQAVAKGAAIYAEAFVKEKQPTVKRESKVSTIKKLNRVTSRSYGIVAFIGDNERKVCNMILQNSQLPAIQEEVFYTHYDNQKQVSIEVFESAANNYYEEISEALEIGKCFLDIDGNIPQHSPIIVSMRLEENGMLYIHGYEESGNTEVTAHMQTQALLSEDDLIIEKQQVDDIYVKVV